MKNWSLKKKIGVVLLVALIVIQFFPAKKNMGERYGANDYTKSLTVSPEIRLLVENACFDCHSNATKPIWYQNIQPIGWWMNNHVEEGKRELNFSVFNTYKDKRKSHKLEEIAEQVAKGEMAPCYYVMMHKEAKLSDAQKTKIINWANAEASKFKEGETEE